MKLAHWPCTAALASLLVGCSDSTGAKGNPPPNHVESQEILDLRTAGYEIGAPILVDNISITPLKRTDKQEPSPKPIVDYITLDEAIEQGTIEITERKPAVVESLWVRNTGDRPILLVGGDLLVGGQQDRVVAHDVVIPPHKMIAVDVFCVEQGRWHGEKEFTSAKSIVPYSVRTEAIKGKQHEVWNQTRQRNLDYLSLDSDATTVAAGMREAEKRTRNLLAQFERRLNDPEVVGMVYAVNGKVLSVDVFAHPRLFAASKRNLLRGFLAEAATEEDTLTAAPEGKDVAGFLNRVIASKREARAGEDGVARVGRNGIAGAELRAPASSVSAPAVHGYYAAD